MQEKYEVQFIPLQSEHFPLLLKWLETFHVKEWWDSDIHWNLDLIIEKYGSYVEGYKLERGIPRKLSAYIIVYQNKPIGYIQLYNAKDFAREDHLNLSQYPSPLAAIDFYIGEKDYLGKNLGALSMQAFLKKHVDPFYTACLVDPEIENTHAIKAYQKAGFKIVDKHDNILIFLRSRTEI